MQKKLKFIIIMLIIIAIIVLASFIFYSNTRKNEKIEQNEISNNQIADVEQKQEKEEENVMIFGLDKKEEEEEQEEEKQVPQKDASALTQEIYSINGPIGTLNIPKTGLNTQIFSNVTVDKMEEMPCFLYTTGGLSSPGVTLFVGHNRMNGKLFSNNNKLQEGDEFYFTDYKGISLKYTIYSKFITTDDDVSFLNNENQEKPVIALSCCTDKGDMRIIILGRAE